MKKLAVFALSMALAGGVLAGCSSSEPETTETETATAEQTSGVTPEDVVEVEMQYISPEDTEANLDNDEYVIVDVRKAADYEAGHIPGAISADMDAANKGGDIQNGLDTMSAAMTDATGAENGNGKTLVLVCYSGKSYAQVATNILSALGADMDKVLTMEGGMEAWTGDLEEGAAAAEVTPEDVVEVEMQYISPEDTEANLDNDEYVIVDVRKAADYEAGHIPGAISADMDAANKGGDIQNGIDTMSAAMNEATGGIDGHGKTLVLVCYSGKSYAQVGTNILSALGADMDKVVTMEGGMEAWTGETE